MNHFISDNKVSSLRNYLQSELIAFYEEREASNIVMELFRSTVGWNKAELILHLQDTLTESTILRLHFALKKLKSGMPLQYVLGKAYFAGMELSVNESVLIPRPETEELVHWVVHDQGSHTATIIDIGTGSGCMALALKKAMPQCNVFGLDISPEALATAQKNATENNLDVAFLQLDVLNMDLPEVHCDIIVSNPPYIPLSDQSSMRKQVVEWEPQLALFVDNGDALLFYRRILELAIQHRVKSVYFEIHENCGNEVVALARSIQPISVELKKDMQEKDRMIKIVLDH